ncbi:MAG: cytochrome b/b6 domain-containing protein [Desulfobacteraceae bacterium]|jgi:thiosulfate reductase cytochrome b subunit|nr:cytochrome b/b6 domain-containing protein [Desulfobacteraceae bacterium]
MTGQPKRIYLYSRYERFWHWLQMALIAVLLATGLEVHGMFVLSGFQDAVNIHNFTGLAWLIAFFFFTFWMFTTGEWKQYIPTTRKMLTVIRYYSYGIFRGETHPVPKSKKAKHNPLQRLTYLSLAAVMLPIQMISGFLYWSYNSWAAWGLDFLTLSQVAFVHTAMAYAILVFIIIHVYMTTTGATVFAHLKAMITGWEDLEEPEAVEDWEKAGS